ncbi:hypothetical protein P5V15_001687 [Pogonomyrmex californicus]
MSINGGTLRSYDNPTTISFIRDILDGYFPSELQQEYPDGVPFMIEDRRTELYVDDSSSFPGQGYRLRKQSPVDNLLSTSSQKSNNIYQKSSRSSSLKDNSYENIPLLSLPNRRPQIVENRLRSRSASLSRGRLGVTMQSVLRSKALSTAEIDELKITNLTSERFAMKYPRGSKSATYARKSTPPVLRQVNEPTGKSNELRLKVRSLSGSTIYLVHVSADESVTKLYELLDKAMQTSIYKGYKVVLSGYSPKRLERTSISLKENGISRDCVLHLVND